MNKLRREQYQRFYESMNQLSDYMVSWMKEVPKDKTELKEFTNLIRSEVTELSLAVEVVKK